MLVIATLSIILVTLFLILKTISKKYPWPRRDLEYMCKPRSRYSKSRKKVEVALLMTSKTSGDKNFFATPAKCYLSVVVPAMNEEKRLPPMLDECLEYLENRFKQDETFDYEVIVVDDGSTDSTCEVVMKYSEKWPVFLIKLDKNVGKGGAVRNGVLGARGTLILFADADGATRFSDFEKLEKVFQQKHDNTYETSETLVIGSRAHLEMDSIAQRSLFRTFLMFGFHCIVYIFAVRSINDTQCGFKLFSRKAAAQLFPRIHVERWAFDVELLYLAEKLKYCVHEVAVDWHEVEGSKISPLLTSIEMGRDIVLIWYLYLVGVWNMRGPETIKSN